MMPMLRDQHREKRKRGERRRTGKIEKLNLAIIVVDDTRNARQGRELVRCLLGLCVRQGAQKGRLTDAIKLQISSAQVAKKSRQKAPREADEGDASVTEFFDVEAVAWTTSCFLALEQLCTQLGQTCLQQAYEENGRFKRRGSAEKSAGARTRGEKFNEATDNTTR